MKNLFLLIIIALSCRANANSANHVLFTYSADRPKDWCAYGLLGDQPVEVMRSRFYTDNGFLVGTRKEGAPGGYNQKTGTWSGRTAQTSEDGSMSAQYQRIITRPGIFVGAIENENEVTFIRDEVELNGKQFVEEVVYFESGDQALIFNSCYTNAEMKHPALPSSLNQRHNISASMASKISGKENASGVLDRHNRTVQRILQANK